MNKQDEIIQTTKQLVSINSVVSSVGEQKIAQHIMDELSQLPYFQQNPTHLIKQPIRNDKFNRFNVVALIKHDQQAETLVGIGHLDTVDVSDFGEHANIAFDVDASTNALKLDNDDKNVLYGRGVLDMKSGVAVWVELIKTHSEGNKKSGKNLVVAFVFDEEGTSLGMRSVLTLLISLREEHHLSYLGAIDTDYTTSQYKGDDHRYVYFGTVGKLLVKLYVVGQETHASDPFLGVDANLMMANIVQEIDLNPNYTDAAQDKTTPPPIMLHMANPKETYSVKTNKIAYADFNVIMTGTIHEWLVRFKIGVEKALEATRKQLDERINQYYTNNEYPQAKHNLNFEVMFVDEFNERFNHAPTSDEPDMIKRIRNTDQEGGYVVIGVEAPYYPAHTCTISDQDFVDCIMNALAKHPLESLQVEPYYPYISDLSYLRSPSEDELVTLKQHAFDASWIDQSLWHLASELDLPMVNIGPYGYDAHKKRERLFADSVVWVYDVIQEVLGGKS